VRGLRKSFAEKEAVAGIDLDIAAGSLAGLVGPTGAGKTTSLSMMTGLLRPVAEARSRAAQLLDVLDLAADAKRLVADYSTGMRKKAALGCALIHNPPVLFLDEPLEGVDPISADVIRRLLT
jgi:ABC-2 type transport system ATP-binding protein